MLYDGSDNDPEKWSKNYQRVEAFPLCNEPYLKLPDNSLNSSIFDHPHGVSTVITLFVYKCPLYCVSSSMEEWLC